MDKNQAKNNAKPITDILIGMRGDIIKRKSGLTDKMMLERCSLMAGIVNKTVDVKFGRGKNVSVVKKNKYYTDEKTIEKINRSVIYYKEKMESKIELRDYQKQISEDACVNLSKDRFVYLAMEVRTGKTLTSLNAADLMGCSNVLFLTKKKAISSIEADFGLLMPSYKITVTNYESLHKVESPEQYDMLILDEAHSMGAFPKPSNRAKQVREIIKSYNPYVILLSGTPTPESYSQMYHQVYGIKKNPFIAYKNFYRFCDDYANVTERKINGMMIKDYTKGFDKIIKEMKPHTISYSLVEAGFNANISEHILHVPMSEMTYKLAKKLKKDLVIEGNNETILADTPVKLMMKLHQLYSGTIKFESGGSTIIDLSKAMFIHDNFGDSKIGIFYKFKEELNALMKVFGAEYLTTDLDEFKNTDKSIALQIVSGREGISLKEAECLVYYNIDFSATSYWQSRDRMTTKERLKSDVYWVFAEGGIEDKIYKAVSDKKNYTTTHFKRDLLNL